MAPRNHAACVASYCDAILSGEIIAGHYVELAVRRYLDDLEHAHERGLHFDAEKSLQFVETVCTHQKAEWAGQPFLLSPNQQFILWNVGGFTTTLRDYTAHWATNHLQQRLFSRRLNTIQSPLKKWTHSRGQGTLLEWHVKGGGLELRCIYKLWR